MKFEQMRNEFLKEAKIRQKELVQQQSKYDLMLTDAEHFLENEKCDAVVLVKTAKLIKELRQKRRQIKVELEKLQSARDTMTKGMIRFDNKSYTYRTAIMNSISNKSLKG